MGNNNMGNAAGLAVWRSATESGFSRGPGAGPVGQKATAGREISISISISNLEPSFEIEFEIEIEMRCLSP
jgi:hypothetical protein